jgi:hypothetical protein
MTSSRRTGASASRVAVCVAALIALPAMVARAAPTLKLAQTHVLDVPRTTWPTMAVTTTSGSGLEDLSLHLVGEREALVLVEFGSGVAAPSNARIDVSNDETTSATTIVLSGPSSLPGPYETGGDAYSTTAYSCELPAWLVKRGLTITVKEDSATTSETFASITVGVPSSYRVVTLPLYYFGTDPATTMDGSTALTASFVGEMAAAKAADLGSRLPVRDFSIGMHPLRYVKFPYAIINPRGGFGYRMRNTDERRDGYASMSHALHFLYALRLVEGVEMAPVQYYSAMIQADSNGHYVGPGGGLGGGGRAVGDYSMTGVLHHELGHGFGLGHSSDEYASGGYPYPNGSLKGSAWGYDNITNQFIDNIYKACRSTDTSRQREDGGARRCFKQDPMQGGAADGADGQVFSMFSDWNAARIQRWFEGKDPDSSRIYEDVMPGVKYARWNVSSQSFVDSDDWVKTYRVTNVPAHRNVQMTTVIFSISCPEIGCDTSGFRSPPNNSSALTTVYAPLSYTGNSREFVDIDNATLLARYHWKRVKRSGEIERRYCDSGCDFIGTFHFQNAAKSRLMLPLSFRSWVEATDPFRSAATDPLDGSSLLHVGAAVLGTNVERIDLEWLPKAWEGAHARVPQLLTSWDSQRGEVRAPPQAEAYEPLVIAYEFNMTVPPTHDHCAVSRTTFLFHALEKAVFKSIGGDVLGSAAGVTPTLPPLSRVKVQCVCNRPACPRDCETSFKYPLPEYPPPSAISSSVPTAWYPQCGCNFNNFDGASTCSTSDAHHQSTLTRHTAAPGVYYFENSNGDGMMVEESPTIGEQYDKSFEENVAICRATEGCVMIEFEINHARNKTVLKAAQREGAGCMSPCYRKDYWNRIAYHIDHENEWAMSPNDRSSGAISFQTAVRVTTVSGAATALATLRASSTIENIASTLAADASFTSLVPWTVSPSSFQVVKIAVPASPPASPPPPSGDTSTNASESARRALLANGAIAGIVVGSCAFAILVYVCIRYNANRRAARVQGKVACQGGLPQGAHGPVPHVFGKVVRFVKRRAMNGGRGERDGGDLSP